MKPGAIAQPDTYLGEKIKPVKMPDGSTVWAQSASHYCQEAVKNVEQWLDKRDMKLGGKADTPMATTYRPELDVSPELNKEEASWYQSAIGVLGWWAIELGRYYIVTEVSMLASHMALPQRGHLYAVAIKGICILEEASQFEDFV